MKKKTYKLPKIFKAPSSSQPTTVPPTPVANLPFFSLPPPPELTSTSGFSEYIKYGFLSFHQQIQYLNNSKLFAGLIVIILNIAGKFVNFKLSKTMESYMKHTFSRNVLIFCIAWMGSREIYVAFLITFLCILFMDFVCNENSGYCMLPETFKNYHISLLDKSKPTSEEIKNAKEILERAGEKITPNNKSNSV